jgi:hypothetical protein
VVSFQTLRKETPVRPELLLLRVLSAMRASLSHDMHVWQQACEPGPFSHLAAGHTLVQSDLATARSTYNVLQLGGRKHRCKRMTTGVVRMFESSTPTIADDAVHQIQIPKEELRTFVARPLQVG